jgi:hypothetical protein
VLGEFFAASPESVGLSGADGPSAGAKTVAAKGLSEVSLATLGEILGAGTYDDLLDVIGDGIDAEGGEAGVLPIPDKMRMRSRVSTRSSKSPQPGRTRRS